VNGSKSIYKSIKDYIKKNTCTAAVTIIAANVILLFTLPACCIDMTSFLEPKEVSISFSNNPEITVQKDVSDVSKNNDNLKTDYSDIKKVLADTINYEISLAEEEELFRNLEKIYDEEKFMLVKEYLKGFKYLYPQGYFTIIKVTQKQEYSAGYNWFELMNNSSTYVIEEVEDFLEDFDEEAGSLLENFDGFEVINPSTDFYGEYSKDIIVIVHELTHCGSGPYINLFIEDADCHFYQDYSYLAGNLVLLIERDRVFFSKYEVFQDIKNPDLFDKVYLDQEQKLGNEEEDIKPGDVDFTNILDEINAYTVSTKCAIATEQYASQDASSSDRYGLLKQMSHLELYLKRCYEKHPEDWEYLISHKGMAFFIMKLWQEAEKMEAVIKDDTRFNRGSEAVSEFVYDPVNYNIVEMLFEKSGVIDFKNFSFKDSNIQLDGLTVYDIGSL